MYRSEIIILLTSTLPAVITRDVCGEIARQYALVIITPSPFTEVMLPSCLTLRTRAIIAGELEANSEYRARLRIVFESIRARVRGMLMWMPRDFQLYVYIMLRGQREDSQHITARVVIIPENSNTIAILSDINNLGSYWIPSRLL